MLVAVVSAVASAVAVCAIFLAAGAFEREPDRARRSAATTSSSAPAASPADIYRRARLGVALIDHRPPGVKARTGPPTRDDGVATGSAFVIDRHGHLVTNQHIVAGRGTTTVQFDPGEDPLRATVIGRDASTDLALVKVDRADAGRLTVLALGSSRAVRIGDLAIAIGNPFGLERSLAVGVVSATDRSIDAPDRTKIRNAVQTDAPINPGNSGGPLLDARGRVIGVLSQRRGEGIAFAVPVDTVKRVVARLRRRAPAATPARPPASASGTRLPGA